MTPVLHESITPLMQQYREIRAAYPDTLLLFQVGDFYELFFEDAKQAASILGIALTARGKQQGEPIPLCGVPVQTLDHYAAKLVRAGFKVALCHQLEQAQPGKMVRRGVTQVLTPGTLTDSKLLEEKRPSYLLSFFPLESACGLIFGELMTAQLFGTVLPTLTERGVEAELVRFFPDEVLVPPTSLGRNFQRFFSQAGYFTSVTSFDLQAGDNQEQLATWIDKFHADVKQRIASHEALYGALQNFYGYVRATQQRLLQQFSSFYVYQPDDFLLIDRATQRNLELLKNNHDGSSNLTLFSVLDGAITPMGSRMIRKWIVRPLVKKEAISQRHDVIEVYVTDLMARHTANDILKRCGDIERVIGRIALARAHVHDYVHLTRVLRLVPLLRQTLREKSALALLLNLLHNCADFAELSAYCDHILNEDETKDWIIKSGFDEALDCARNLIEDSSAHIIALEQREQKATGISSLKVRSNDAHGYYIEITHTHKDAVPAHYIRKQTLVGRERFTTQELQKLERDVHAARIQAQSLEQGLFSRFQETVAQHIYDLRKLAHVIAHFDALVGLARVAYERRYVRPTWNDERAIVITQGRHPVVESVIESQFIANDTRLDCAQSLLIITGPNMGGKSTYLRQNALIALMAHMGSFVPAQAASLPILDRIFTRIGAGDNVVQGKSTFLVEMEETAAICAQATEHSLVILDEVGRGTSTFDGLALAQAVIEYIHTQLRARCLFATHYRELTKLAATLPGIAAYHAASMRDVRGIVLLHTIVPGVADGSFGIEVAKLARLAQPVIQRAEQILHLLQQECPVVSGSPAPFDYERAPRSPSAAALYTSHPVLAVLASLDCDVLSPKASLDLLFRLQEMAKQR